ncbi:MarR family winged helix-turn-helix transcriptional regulator [Nocardiopsis coralliicola]
MTSSEGLSDDELITAWGLLIEAVDAAEPVLLAGVDPSGEDMPGPWFGVLIRLQRSPGQRLPMSVLAREVHLSSGGFTKLADRLERKGYLVRESCADDRRVVYAALTESGAALTAEAKRRHAALLREHVVGVVGTDGLQTLSRLARSIRDAASLAG